MRPGHDNRAPVARRPVVLSRGRRAAARRRVRAAGARHRRRGRVRRRAIPAAGGRPDASLERSDRRRLAQPRDRDGRGREPSSAPGPRSAAGGRRLPGTTGRAALRAARSTRLLRRRLLHRPMDRQRRSPGARPPPADRRRPRLRRGEPRRSRPDEQRRRTPGRRARARGPPQRDRPPTAAARLHHLRGRRRVGGRTAGSCRSPAPRVRTDHAAPPVRGAARTVRRVSSRLSASASATTTTS